MDLKEKTRDPQMSLNDIELYRLTELQEDG